jgi:hypothetical protein
MHPFIEQVYSANSEVVLKSLIREFREAKEAHTKLEVEESEDAAIDNQAKRNSSHSSSLSSSISSSAHVSHSMDKAAMTTGEFIDLASSDTIIVRQDGEEEEEDEADRAWGTMVVNAEEEATGQFRKMFAAQKTAAASTTPAAAAAAAAAPEEAKQADAETQEKATSKKREKRKKRAHSPSTKYTASAAGKKKRKSVEEDLLALRGDGGDDGEEEWEKGLGASSTNCGDEFEIAESHQRANRSNAVGTKTKKQKKQKPKPKKSKEPKKRKQHQKEEDAEKESEDRRIEAEAEGAKERQLAMLEESLALEKQLAQIDSILDSIRGVSNDQTTTTTTTAAVVGEDGGDDRQAPPQQRSESAALDLTMRSSPGAGVTSPARRHKSKIEARMEKMRDELLAQRRSVPVPFEARTPSTVATTTMPASLASSFSFASAEAATARSGVPPTTSTLTEAHSTHRLATSAPPTLSRRERGQKRNANDDEGSTNAPVVKDKQSLTQHKAKRARLLDRESSTRTTGHM